MAAWCAFESMPRSCGASLGGRSGPGWGGHAGKAQLPSIQAGVRNVQAGTETSETETSGRGVLRTLSHVRNA